MLSLLCIWVVLQLLVDINIAKASNIEVEENTITSLDKFSNIINDIKETSQVKFICVKCGLDDETPRPPLDVVKVNKF